MSEATVRGKVHVIEETKTFGQRVFRKRLVVLEDDTGRFTSYIPLEFIQDACDSVDSMSIGDNVEVRYRLSGRKWQRDPGSEVKYFLTAEAISFKSLGSGGGGGPVGGDFDVDDINAKFAEASDENADDVPF